MWLRLRVGRARITLLAHPILLLVIGQTLAIVETIVARPAMLSAGVGGAFEGVATNTLIPFQLLLEPHVTVALMETTRTFGT